MEFLANERDRIIKALLWWNILEIECEILMYHCWFVKGTATSQAVYIRKRNTSFAQVILFKYIPEFDYHQVTIHPISHYFDALTNYITPLQGTSSVPRVFFFFFCRGWTYAKMSYHSRWLKNQNDKNKLIDHYNGEKCSKPTAEHCWWPVMEKYVKRRQPYPTRNALKVRDKLHKKVRSTIKSAVLKIFPGSYWRRQVWLW